jgi:hypothetical protein
VFAFALYSYTVDLIYSLEILLLSPKLDQFRKLTTLFQDAIYIIFTFQHRDTQETLAVLDRLDLDTDKPSDEDLAKKFGYEDDYYSGKNFEKWSCFGLKRWMI